MARPTNYATNGVNETFFATQRLELAAIAEGGTNGRANTGIGWQRPSSFLHVIMLHVSMPLVLGSTNLT
jgi:hypothetical protein